MAYYYAGNRGGKPNKEAAVKSTEMQSCNLQNEKYPGSVMMRERGWNPYRDEEEPMQYMDGEMNRGSQMWEGNKNNRRQTEDERGMDWGDRPEESRGMSRGEWTEEGRGMNRGVWLEEGQGMNRGVWPGESRGMSRGEWQERNRGMNQGDWSEEGRGMNQGVWKEEGRGMNQGDWQEEDRGRNQARRNWEGKTMSGRGRDCRDRGERTCSSSFMMEMPGLNDSEQEAMKQWDQISLPPSGQSCWRASGSRNGQPYQKYDYLNVLEDEQMMERELRKLQSMYPQAAKEILPLIEEVCDKMEYEGSMMFDEHPDQNTVRRMSDDIYGQVKALYPAEEEQQPEEMQSMEYQDRRRRPPHGNFLDDLVQVMLVQEMHRRRCRHHRCRPQRY